MKRRVGPASAFAINSFLESGTSIYMVEVAVIEGLIKTILPKYNIAESDWIKAYFSGEYRGLLSKVFSPLGNAHLLMAEETYDAMINELFEAFGNYRYPVQLREMLYRIDLYIKVLEDLFGIVAEVSPETAGRAQLGVSNIPVDGAMNSNPTMSSIVRLLFVSSISAGVINLGIHSINISAPWSAVNSHTTQITPPDVQNHQISLVGGSQGALPREDSIGKFLARVEPTDLKMETTKTPLDIQTLEGREKITTDAFQGVLDQIKKVEHVAPSIDDAVHTMGFSCIGVFSETLFKAYNDSLNFKEHLDYPTFVRGILSFAQVESGLKFNVKPHLRSDGHYDVRTFGTADFLLKKPAMGKSDYYKNHPVEYYLEAIALMDQFFGTALKEADRLYTDNLLKSLNVTKNEGYLICFRVLWNEGINTKDQVLLRSLVSSYIQESSVSKVTFDTGYIVFMVYGTNEFNIKERAPKNERVLNAKMKAVDALISLIDAYTSINGASLDEINRRILEIKGPKKSAQLSNTGGVDLTPANMNLQTQNSGEAIKFHLDPAQLERLQNAPGFVPVIINIQPLNNLKQFLGIDASSSL